MRSGFGAVAILLLCLVVGAPATAQPAGPTNLPGVVRIRYDNPNVSSPALKRARDLALNYRLLEYMQTLLSPLRLPRDFTIVAAQCDGELARYRSNPATVMICYERIARILAVAEEKGQAGTSEARIAITGAIITTLLRETAIGLFDVLNVPVWGRIEDAADNMAAFIVTQFGEDVARVSVLGTAKYLMWTRKTASAAQLASDQSPEMQRFFTFVCIGFGGAPEDILPLISNELPDNVFALARFRRCAREATSIRKAFNLRITPFVDPEKLVRARAAIR